MPDSKSLSPSSAIVFYDASCLLCANSVRWIIAKDPECFFSFASLHSEYCQQHLDEQRLQEVDSLILLENKNLYLRSEAALRILSRLKTRYRMLRIARVLPAAIRDLLYRFIAKNRHRYQPTTGTLISAKERALMPTRFLD